VRKGPGRGPGTAHVTPVGAVHAPSTCGDAPDTGRRRGPGTLVGVNRRLVLAGLIWAAVSVLAFVALGNVIVATGLVVFGFVLIVVLAMASDWEQHPDFEEREMYRAQRRAVRWQRGAGARARDRERWEAHQARKAARTRTPGGDGRA
jgi:hypothetical protein